VNFALAFVKTGVNGGGAKSKVGAAAVRESGHTKVEDQGKQVLNSMNESKKPITKRNGELLFLCLALGVSAYAQASSKHAIGEAVAQFAAKAGVNLNACHKKTEVAYLRLHIANLSGAWIPRSYGKRR
jgi:hypothetical protein